MNLVPGQDAINKQSNIKDKIVVAADEFFSRFGFQKTTMDEIARKIHKAKGALYYYFKGKEELYTEVIRREFDTVRNALDVVIQQEVDPVVKLENYITVRFKTLKICVNYHETLQADFRESYEFVRKVREDFDNYERNVIKQVLIDGQADGYFSLSDIDSTINVFMIMMKSIEIPLYLQGAYEKYENIIFEITTILFDGLKKNKS